jgi:signal transduction histidine kinase
LTLRGRLLVFVLSLIAVFGALCLSAGLLLHSKMVPILDQYLERKAQATVLALAGSLDGALGHGDSAAASAAISSLASDPDLGRIEVRDTSGAILASIGDDEPIDVSRFDRRRVTDTGHELVSWAVVKFEGVPLGTVAVAFSKARQTSISIWMMAAAITVVAATLISLLIAFRFSRSFVRPIQAMMQFSRRVKEGGLSERVEGSATGELSILAGDLNAMATAIESRDAALAHRGRELEQSLVQLREAQDELLQSTRLASVGEMSGRTAHEVLNPMTGIHFRLSKMLKDARTAMQPNLVTMGEIVKAWRDTYRAEGIDGLARALSAPAGETGQMTLLEEDLDNLTGIEAYLAENHRTTVSDLEFLIKEAGRVTHIVDGMRSLTRAAGTPTLARVRSLVEESLETMRDSAARRNIDLSLELEADEDVLVDRYEFIQILGNLIRNAFFAVEEQRARAGGLVHISTRRAGDVIEVRVHDNGCGIRPEHVSLLFEASFTTRSATEGTGLGLSIARRLARSFQGDLRLEWTASGEGSTFLLEIPAASARHEGKGGDFVAA